MHAFIESFFKQSLTRISTAKLSYFGFHSLTFLAGDTTAGATPATQAAAEQVVLSPPLFHTFTASLDHSCKESTKSIVNDLCILWLLIFFSSIR